MANADVFLLIVLTFVRIASVRLNNLQTGAVRFVFVQPWQAFRLKVIGI